MDADYFRLTYDFSCWARDRLFVAANGLSDDEWRRDNGFTYKSIGGILLHAMQAERLNTMRMMGSISGPAPAQSTEVPPASELLAQWQEAEATLRPWLATLDEAALHRLHATRNGETEVWKTLAHMGYHSMQHRSEAAEALTLAGSSPGNLDLIIYFAEREQPTAS